MADYVSYVGTNIKDINDRIEELSQKIKEIKEDMGESEISNIKSTPDLIEYLKKYSNNWVISSKGLIPILEKIEANNHQALEKEYYKGYLEGMNNTLSKKA